MAVVMELALHGGARADYTAANTFNLQPAGFSPSLNNGAGGVQQAGYGKTGTNFHALIWSGSAASYVDIHPAALTQSYIFGSTYTQQVGAGYGTSTANTNHALLWSNTAASVVDLTPLGVDESYAYGASGAYQAGYGRGLGTGYFIHAFLWNGTAASAVDLQPTNPNFVESHASAISGAQQVGYGLMTTNLTHALMWSGTAASAVDLNPSGFSETYGYATNGTRQFGSGYGLATGSALHALVWNGSAADFVDMHPAGYDTSQINAANDTQFVGMATNSNKQYAMLWNGTGSTPVDLTAMVSGASQAYAQAIDAYGNISGVAVIQNKQQAVEWFAGDTYKVAGGTGTWNASSNWLSGTPAAGNDVQLLSSDATNRTVTYANANAAIVLGKLTVDGAGAGSMTLAQAQDSLRTANEFVGFIGRGTHLQTGGVNTITGSLTLGAKSGGSGVYNLSAGSLTLASLNVGSAAGGIGNFSSSGAAVLSVSAGAHVYAGSSATFGGTQAWGAGATLTTEGTIFFESDAGSVATSPLHVVINAETVTFGAAQHLAGLNVNGGSAILRSSGGGNGAYPIGASAGLSGSKIASLSFASPAAGQLDITNNALIVQAANSTSKATMIQQIAGETATIANSTNGSFFNIISSTATTNANYATVIVDNADLGLSSFGGLAVDSNSIIVTQALQGDANLDGFVDFTDYNLWLGYVGNENSYSAASGDFNGDGFVDFTDYNLWLGHVGSDTSGGVPFGSIGSLGAGGVGGSSPVPEPASLALLAGGALGLIARRKAKR